jgi:hypothetical protein
MYVTRFQPRLQSSSRHEALMAMVTILLLAGAARAQPAYAPPNTTSADAAGASAHDDARTTQRVHVAGGIGLYASHPMSISDPAPLLLVSKPLWLGARHSSAQWVADAAIAAGYGTESSSMHVAVAPRVGVDVFLGRMFGFELRVGPTIVAQVGPSSAAAVGMMAGGGYVFRFWDDDRKRLKLLVHLQAAGYLASDPDNDMFPNAMAMGMALGYEQPY